MRRLAARLLPVLVPQRFLVIRRCCCNLLAAAAAAGVVRSNNRQQHTSSRCYSLVEALLEEAGGARQRLAAHLAHPPVHVHVHLWVRNVAASSSGSGRPSAAAVLRERAAAGIPCAARHPATCGIMVKAPVARCCLHAMRRGGGCCHEQRRGSSRRRRRRRPRCCCCCGCHSRTSSIRSARLLKRCRFGARALAGGGRSSSSESLMLLLPCGCCQERVSVLLSSCVVFWRARRSSDRAPPWRRAQLLAAHPRPIERPRRTQDE